MRGRTDLLRRIDLLRPARRGPELCDCAAALADYAAARVPCDDNGICRHCHKPISGNWAALCRDLERIYGTGGEA